MKYYLFSVKWTYRGDFALKFWGRNSSGYSMLKDNIGLYDKKEAFTIASTGHGSAFPIPQEIVDKLWTKVVYEPQYSPQEGFIVISNSYTRGILKIDPFLLKDECRIDHTCFIIKDDCKWLHTHQETYKIIKTDSWDIIIKDPVEPCEFGSIGTVKGRTYKEARREAFKEVDSIYIDVDFIKTMNRFKVVRKSKKILTNPIEPKTWENYERNRNQ